MSATDVAQTVRIEDGTAWIGDRSFPWAKQVDVNDRHLDGANPWRERRFRLRFENGWELSVVFGTGAYCENYLGWNVDPARFTEECPDAEIAAWCGESDMLPWDSGDTVKGRVLAADVLRLIDQMMTWPNGFPEGAVLTLDGIKRTRS